MYLSIYQSNYLAIQAMLIHYLYATYSKLQMDAIRIVTTPRCKYLLSLSRTQHRRTYVCSVLMGKGMGMGMGMGMGIYILPDIIAVERWICVSVCAHVR